MKNIIKIAVVCGALVLGGCASMGHFEYSNATPGEHNLVQDQKQCNYEAEIATVNSGKGYSTGLVSAIAQDRERYRLYNTCMDLKGWTKKYIKN